MMQWNEKTTVKPMNDCTLLIHPERGTFRKINASGASIVNRLIETPSLSREALYAMLADIYEIPETLFKDDVAIFLDDLCSDEFIFDTTYNQIKPYKNVGYTDNGLWLKLTNRCNLFCTYCYADSHASDTSHEITLDEIKVILDTMQHRKLGKIVLTGGEPLLRKDILEIAKLCKNYGLVQVLSNGTIPSKELYKDIIETVDMLQISIDSMDKKTNDLNRGEGTYDKVMETVCYLSNIAPSKLTLSMTIVPGAENQINDMIQFCYEKGIENLHINRFVPYGRAKTNFDQTLNLRKFYKAIDAGYDYIRSLYQKNRNMRFNLDVANDFVKSIYGSGLKKSCGLKEALISVECNGDIYMCSSLHQEEFKLGSIREMPLNTILDQSHTKFQSFHVDHLTNCKSCELRHFCGGACRALAVNDTQDIYGIDNCCDLYKERIFDLMTRI